MKIRTIILLIFLSGQFLNSVAQEFDFRGMAAGWATLGYNNQWAGQMGGRYIPAIDVLLPLKNKLTIEGEFSANITSTYTSPSESDNFYGKLKPYRMWLKISGKQFEVRAGLQKINFGSASMLRPLMWFDSIDPRDPLQLTDGVYGLLGRYYTMNNINLWAWGLIGNTNKKGWELYGTDKNKIEFGGRLQLPLPKAEIGLSYHHRQGKIPADGFIILNDEIFPENRLGVDLRADLGIGLWIEDVLKHQEIDQLYNYSNMLTLGADYTFGIGTGLNMVAEHFIYQWSEDKIFGNDESISFTAISAAYNLSITASLNAIAYYDWSNKEFYRFLNLGLSFDRFSYYIMGFWNPDNFRIFETRSGPSLFNGTGIQIMAVFNH